MSVEVKDPATGLTYVNNNPIVNDGQPRLATEDEVMNKYPGNIALAGDVAGSYYGCRALAFMDDRASSLEAGVLGTLGLLAALVTSAAWMSAAHYVGVGVGAWFTAAFLVSALYFWVMRPDAVTAEDKLNAWGDAHIPAYIVVNIHRSPGRVSILYTAQLDLEEQEVLKERWPIIEAQLADVRKRKREQLEASKQVEAKEQEERLRLQATGVKCEQHHKTLQVEYANYGREMRQLRNKVVSLELELATMKAQM